MTFYNRIESVRGIAIDLTNGRKWRGASDKAAVFDALDAARREYMRLSDENAKLRELCADLLKGFDCGWPSDVCGDCERDGIGIPIGGCKLENRARELGVEVDG